MQERGVKRAKAEPATARLGPFGTSCAPQNPQLNTLSPLHQEIVEFAQEATPSAAENQLVMDPLDCIIYSSWQGLLTNDVSTKLLSGTVMPSRKVCLSLECQKVLNGFLSNSQFYF